MRHCTTTWQAATCALWLIALLAASTVRTAAVQQLPRADLPKWNRAFKVSVWNFTQEQFPNFLASPCSDSGYDTDPVTVALGACFYASEPNGTFSYWVKKSGDWREQSNCYCYALNIYKGGFCIPGANNPDIDAAFKSRDTFTCDLLRRAVTFDGAKEVTREVALSTQPLTGHYIALMVRADTCNPYHCLRNDFHAARKDADGFWSWKEPGGPASDKDIFGHKITDPSTAILPGLYDQFCGFWWVDPANMSIGVVEASPTLQDLLTIYKQQPGVEATLQPLPYNPAVEGSYDSKTQQQIEQDAQWESKRGTKAYEDFYKQQQQQQQAVPGSGNNLGPGSEPVITPINLSPGRTNLGRINIDPTYGRVNIDAGLGRIVLGNLSNAGGVGRGTAGVAGTAGDHPASAHPPAASSSSSTNSSSISASGSNSAAVPATGLNSSGGSSSSVSALPVLLNSSGSSSGTVAAGAVTAGSSSSASNQGLGVPGQLPAAVQPATGSIPSGSSSGSSSAAISPSPAALVLLSSSSSSSSGAAAGVVTNLASSSSSSSSPQAIAAASVAPGSPQGPAVTAAANASGAQVSPSGATVMPSTASGTSSSTTTGSTFSSVSGGSTPGGTTNTFSSIAGATDADAAGTRGTAATLSSSTISTSSSGRLSSSKPSSSGSTAAVPRDNAALLRSVASSSTNTSTPQMRQELLKAATAAVGPTNAAGAGAGAGAAASGPSGSTKLYDSATASLEPVNSSSSSKPLAKPAGAASSSKRQKQAAALPQAANSRHQQLPHNITAISSSSSSSSRRAAALLQPSPTPGGHSAHKAAAAKNVSRTAAAAAAAAAAASGRRALREKSADAVHLLTTQQAVTGCY